MTEFRSGNKLMRLSEAEYRYLRNGTVADGYIEQGDRKRTDKLEKQIEKRVELLPARFEMLFEDIEQLHEGRFEFDNDSGEGQGDEPEPDDRPKSVEGSHYRPLDTESGLRALISLLGFEDHTRQEVINELTYSGKGRNSASADFGAKLGLMVYRIMGQPGLEPEHIEYDDIVADLIWGFLKGLCFDWRKAGDVTPELVEETSVEILDLVEERVKPTTEIMRNDRERLMTGELARIMYQSPWADVKCLMANRVNDIVAEQGITTGRELGLEEEERSRTDAEDTEARLCYDMVDYIIDHYIDTDARIGAVGQIRDFRDEYGPRKEFEVDKFVTEDLVNQILREKRPREQLQLMSLVEKDIERLRGKTPHRKVAAVDVFKEVAETNGPLTSAEIGIQLGREKALVTRVAKDLAGLDYEGREQHEVWNDRPLLEGDSGRWKITDYGKVVYKRLEEREGPWSGLFDMIPDSVLLDAIDELKIFQLDLHS